MSERPGTIRLPARDIPVPSTLSREAQAVLASPPSERAEYPALDDPDAWRAMIAAHDDALATMMAGRAAAPVTVVKRDLPGGARVYGWPPGCGPWTTGCRPTTPSRPDLTTASLPTARCSASGRPSGSSSAAPRPAATSRPR